MTGPTDPATTAPAASILDEHRSSPGLLLALLGQEAMRRLRAAHTAHNLKPRQFQILGLLHDHGGLAQRELMQEMGVDPSILVTLLNPLEADGLVTRERDPADRRRHLVTLTPAGERAPRQRIARAERNRGRAVRLARRRPARAAASLLVVLRDGLAADPESACSVGRRHPARGDAMRAMVFGATASWRGHRSGVSWQDRVVAADGRGVAARRYGVSACWRSRQRSSGCSQPTLSRRRPGGRWSWPGMAARRSMVDSTPPRLVA